MTGKRKRYSADFKANVALEALRGGQTVAHLAAKHGVHQTMINTWKKQAIEGIATLSSGKSEAPMPPARARSTCSTPKSANWW